MIVAMACAKDGKITSFFQSSPKDVPLPICWTAYRHNVAIVCGVPLASSSQDFANGRVPDLLVYMVTTYAALDPMYVDVVSCISVAISAAAAPSGYDTLYLRTYVRTCDHTCVYRARALALALLHAACNCVMHK